MQTETIETRNARRAAEDKARAEKRAAEADARRAKADAYAAECAAYFVIRDAYCANGSAANKAAYEAARVKWVAAVAAVTA
jgi:hypothetical protein